MNNVNESETNIVWKPIPGSSQEIALDARAHHILLSGERGAMKTDTQLMRFRRRVGIGYGAFWRGIIFDREYKNLEDIITKSKRWFPQFKDGARFLESASSLKWVWPTGEELLFRVAKNEEDYWNYHGHEYPFIGWNELTKYPTPKVYDMMMSTNRSSFTLEKDAPRIDPEVYRTTGEKVHDPKGIPDPDLPPMPLEVIATTNPYGPGHNWVKKRFIDPAPYGVPVITKTRIFDPKTKQDIDVEKVQVTIFGSWTENIYLSPEYIAELHNEKDENRRKAWLNGDWDIVAGGAFDDVWNKAKQVKRRFVVPEGWRIDRSFDWGSSHPFSVGWWAEANGEEAKIVHPDGSIEIFCPPKGSLIRIFEWYGTKDIGTNDGLRLSAKKVAEGIRDIEIALLQAGWIKTQPKAGAADNQIRNVTEKDVETIEKKMSDVGIKWIKSDKSAGSRINGLELARTMLENASEGAEDAGLYFMDCCRSTLAILPTLPRDPKNMDDVDTDSEDHIWDDIRYRILQNKDRLPQKLRVVPPK